MPVTYTLSDVLAERMRPMAKALTIDEQAFVAIAVAEKVAREEQALWEAARHGETETAEVQIVVETSEHKAKN